MENITRQDVEKIIEERFNVNYHAGVPRIPPHTHNGIDNLQISSSNIIGLSTGGINGLRIITSSGTFTAPIAGKYLVQGQGAGAGSGSTGATPNFGQSGGGGGYCESLITLTAGQAVTATIGAGGAAGSPNGADGGNTTFGAYFTAGGGLGDGSAGTATGGDLNVPGCEARLGFLLAAPGSSSNMSAMSGDGGGSFFGPGARGAKGAIGTQVDGIAATRYGTGASGGAAGTAGSTTVGASGASGLIIITW